jgi:hypothetical protein
MRANVFLQSGVKPRLMISTTPSQSDHRCNMSISPVRVSARLIATTTRKCGRQSVEQVHVGLHPARATGRECQKRNGIGRNPIDDRATNTSPLVADSRLLTSANNARPAWLFDSVVRRRCQRTLARFQKRRTAHHQSHATGQCTSRSSRVARTIAGLLILRPPVRVRTRCVACVVACMRERSFCWDGCVMYVPHANTYPSPWPGRPERHCRTQLFQTSHPR